MTALHSLNTPLCPQLNLAPATTCQPTVDPSNTSDSVEMWQICPADQWAAEREGKLQKTEWGNNEGFLETTWRTAMNIHKSNVFPPFVSFVRSPLTFSSFITLPKWVVIFLFCCQPPSQPLSGTSAIIVLSYSTGRDGLLFTQEA